MNGHGDEKMDHNDGLTSPNISLNPFSSPSGGMTFSPDPFGATNGTNGNGFHADSASDASDQESLGHMEEFGMMTVEQLKATNKPESPGIFSSQSVSPSPDADLRPDLGGETLAQLAGQHKGGDSGFISPAGAATSQPDDGYNRDTEPDGVSHGSMDGSQLSHGSVQLMDDLLQMSAQQENEDEQLDTEDQQGEDTKSLEEILAERRDDPEGCENMEESEEDEDDSDSDEEIGEFSFIRTEAAAQLEQPSSQFADQKPLCLDENLQNEEVDLCNFLGKSSAEEIIKEEKNDMEKMDRDDSDSETESEPKHVEDLEESDNLVLLTAETNAIEDECQGEVETLVPTIKTNAIDDASHVPDLEEGSALSSLESQGSAPSSLESQPGNEISLESQPDNEINQESQNDVWSQQLQADVKETVDEEACTESLGMDSFSAVAGGPDRVFVAQLDGPEESGCLVPQGREMPSPQEAVLAVIDNGMSAVTIMEDLEDGKENGFDHRMDNESTSPTFNHNLESNNHVFDEREILSSPEATLMMNDNGPMGVAPNMEEEQEMAISPAPTSEIAISPAPTSEMAMSPAPTSEIAISPAPIPMDEPEESAPLASEVTESPCLLPETPCLVLEEIEVSSPQEVDFTKNDEEPITTNALAEDSEDIPLVEHSDDMKDLIESESISPAPVASEGADHSEPNFVHEPEASVDPGPEDLVDIMFENDDVAMVLKTPQEDAMEEVTEATSANLRKETYNLGTLESNSLDVIADNNEVDIITDEVPSVQIVPHVIEDMAIPEVQVQIVPDMVDMACIPSANLSAISVPDVNLSAIMMPDVDLSAMSTPDLDAGSNLDTINVPDVNVIPATPTRTISPSLKQKQPEESASGSVAQEKPSKDGNKTTAKGPTTSKAPTSRAPTTAAKRTSPAKPAPGASKPGAAKPGLAKPSTKPLTAATKTATSAKPTPAAARTTTRAPPAATTKPRPATTAAKTTTAPRPTTTRPTTTTTKTTTPSSRPTTATSRPTTAPTRPTTAPSKPATSRPATASSRPATASSRPATASSRPATASSRPATASSRPATASSRPATATSRLTSTSRPAAGTSPTRSAATAATTKVPPIKRPTGPAKPLTNGTKGPSERPAPRAGAPKPTTRPAARPTAGAPAPRAAPTAAKTRVPPTGTKPSTAGPARRVPPPARTSPTKPVPAKTAGAKKLPLTKPAAKSAALKPKTSAIEAEPSIDSEVITNGAEPLVDSEVITNGDATHDEDEAHLEMNGDVGDVNAPLENGVATDNAINGTTEPISILDD